MTAEQILKKYGIKKTVCRKCILDKLIESENTALTETEITDAFANLFDRVTFYRSLKTLEENKVIHRIVLNNTTVKYALSEHLVLTKIHPHFHCTRCNKVICLDSSLLDKELALPAGYKIESVQILLEGICSNCQKE
jgi:Fur family ferric uptake transcriptional regulator